jgi:oligoribonuclease NrnB/cAMP/cGMP phosphodiesterase (DHH superfamily)
LKALSTKPAADTTYRVFFTTPTKIFNTLAESIPPIPPGKNAFSIGELYVCDLAVHRDSILGSTIFDNVVWVDHHEQGFIVNELVKELDNVTLIIDSETDSAAELLSKHFEFSSGFENIANEIDTNNVTTPEEERLREVVGALKMKHSGNPNTLSQSLFELAQECSEDIKKISDERYNEILEEYHNWLNGVDELITTKLAIHEINQKNVALFETQESAPVYAVFNTLKAHEKAPFDLIAILTHKPDIKKDRSSIGKPLTTIEFRTHTDINVYEIAKSFGGGGHKYASGAEVIDGMKGIEFLKKIEGSGLI